MTPSSVKGYMMRAADVLANFRPRGAITAITLGLNAFGNGRGREIHLNKKIEMKPLSIISVTTDVLRAAAQSTCLRLKLSPRRIDEDPETQGC